MHTTVATLGQVYSPNNVEYNLTQTIIAKDALSSILLLWVIKLPYSPTPLASFKVRNSRPLSTKVVNVEKIQHKVVTMGRTKFFFAIVSAHYRLH